MSEPRLLEAVKKIVAQRLGKRPEEINPDDTFAKTGADELDLVEIMMAVEEQMGIVISDDDLIRAARATTDNDLAGHLTVRTFALVADAAPKQSAEKAADSAPVEDGTLREAQVGTYRDLSELPNPKGYVLVFIPSFDIVLAQYEHKLGKKLPPNERDALRLRSAVIALPPAMAEEMQRKRAEREVPEIK